MDRPAQEPDRAATSRPRVLVVGAGPFQLDILRTARQMGCEVLTVDRHPDAPGMALAERAFAVDIVDVDAVRELARRERIDAVVTAASDAAIEAVAAVSELLERPGVRPDTVRRCRDKHRTFETLRAAGLAVPETAVVGSPEAARREASRIGLPLVIKPRTAAGGRGVSVVAEGAGLAAAYRRAERYGSGVLAQRYVTGLPVGVEAFFRGGREVATFVMDDQFQPGFVSPVGHSLPCEQQAELCAKVSRDAAAFAAALGLTEGPANFDLRVEGGRTVLIEVNPRLGGNAITDLIRLAHGVDLSAATILAALGRDPAPRLAAQVTRPVASRLLVARGTGRAALGDLDALRARPGVVSIDLTVRDAERPRMVVDEWSILGRCLVRGDTGAQAARAAEELADAVARHVRLVPDA